MKIKRKAGYIPVLAVMAAFTVAPVSNAMHIMEGFLAPAYCIAWGLVCVPFIVLGLRSISRIVERDRKTMLLIAMCAAFAFVLSALKIPSVTGSCSHPTGVGLGAVFFGPLATSVFGLIVLLFQALLLGHGGITTLGANVFSMAIVGPFVSYGVYRLVKKLHGNQYADNLAKAKALAKYAASEERLGRIQLIHKDIDSRGNSGFIRLELTDFSVREKVIRAISNDELNHIFDTDGFFE